MNTLPHIGWLRERLNAPLPGFAAQERMMGRVIAAPPQVPENARLSAVMCLIYPTENNWHMLLMRRMEDGRAHSGQVSFPGGRYEPEDESLLFTALRETEEEVGIASTQINVLGSLSPLYIPVSNFHVFPFVGYAPSRPVVSLSAFEVSYIIETPLGWLIDDRNKITTNVTSPAVPGLIRNVKAYQLADGGIVWGATAMMLSELEVLLRESGLPW